MVVLLAENGGRRSSPRMLWLADVVTNARMDVLLVDLRGHGDSAGLNTYGLGETRDLLAVLEELSREDPGRRLGAVGFSLGAACILRTLSMTDVLRFAVVFAPYSRLDADLVRHEIAYQTQGRGPARLLSPGLLLAAMRLAAGFPALPEPDELSTGRPVLLFHCTGDPEIPFRHALAIAERSRAPRLEIRALERAQHIPPIEDVLVWGDFAAELVALAGASLAK
jgi:alpha-beta hydrolase superfamily lysophospholipase